MSDGVTDARRDDVHGRKNELKQNQKRSTVWQWSDAAAGRQTLQLTPLLSNSLNCHWNGEICHNSTDLLLSWGFDSIFILLNFNEQVEGDEQKGYNTVVQMQLKGG